MNPGAKLFVYTDGVAEATDAQNELFGMDRTVDALDQAADKSPEEILQAVNSAVQSFVGDAGQVDGDGKPGFPGQFPPSSFPASSDLLSTSEMKLLPQKRNAKSVFYFFTGFSIVPCVISAQLYWVMYSPR